MRNDYLWDKTGSDAEVERLEGLLTVHRYQSVEPPAIGRPIAVVPEKMAWWKLSLAFAVPACLLIAVGFAFWASGPTNEIQSASIPREGPVVNAPIVQTEQEKTPIFRTVAPLEPHRASAAPRRITTIKAVHRRQKKGLDTLTAEEKFAYEQLLLALSITGSRLKIVTDTVKGTEN